MTQASIPFSIRDPSKSLLPRDGFSGGWALDEVVAAKQRRPNANQEPNSDERELATFYRATVADTYRYASRLTGRDRERSEDLVQEAYLALVHTVRNGDLSALSLPWITTVIRNRFIDSLRRQDRANRALHRLFMRPANVADFAEDPVKSLSLTERERIAFVLRFIDDLTVAGVADSMGISVRAAASLLARGLRRAQERETNVGLD